MAREIGGRPMEVLLVEDNLADAGLAIEALRVGYVRHRLTLCVNGVEAMEFLRQQGVFQRAPRPDLVLLDLGLPKKDGREVLAEIRADAGLKDIPVIVLTASLADADYLRSQSLGVDGYIYGFVGGCRLLAVAIAWRRWLHCEAREHAKLSRDYSATSSSLARLCEPAEGTRRCNCGYSGAPREELTSHVRGQRLLSPCSHRRQLDAIRQECCHISSPDNWRGGLTLFRCWLSQC
jgi:CheY-like chemotaxis protein